MSWRRPTLWVLFAMALGIGSAFAQSQESVETVTVTGVLALPGTASDLDRLPQTVETLRSEDLSRDGTPNLTGALNDQLGAVTINDNLDDPFQPDILYRGFEASPVLGTPEGLALYQNGVRINEAFGDAVNWDLVPDFAVDRVDVVSANPLYGLNALGGAVIVSMKDGFSSQGGEAEIDAGSWGRRQAEAEYGVNDGTFGLFAAARFQADDGWREFSPDQVAQFYADASYHAAALDIDLSLSAADNRLSGESPAPIGELEVNRALVFTSPQNMRDRVVFPEFSLRYEASDTLALTADLYDRAVRQDSVNGNTTDYTACALSPGFLCQFDGTTLLLQASGQPIPDLSHSRAFPIGELDFAGIRTNGEGGAIEATETADVLGRGNVLSIGASLDHDETDYSSSAEPGIIARSLQIEPSGYFVSTKEGEGWTATPVSLRAADLYLGVFATDTLSLTQDFAMTASGRYNLAQSRLSDERGTALSGHGRYRHFNPALGATEKLRDDLTIFADFSEGNRAPTPSEIECADPKAPCVLPSSLSSDPPTLRQVVSRSWELGARGTFAFADASFAWHGSLFRTDVDNDIYGVATSLSSGYFRNVGGTRRQGVEIGIKGRAGRLSTYASYSFSDASFRSAFVLPSPFNAGADANGDIHIRPGDTLPGIPRHRLKAGADFALTPAWSIGGSLIAESAQYFRGDESNQMKPLAGYAALDLHSTYVVGNGISLFLDVSNATGAKYATFGELGDPSGIGAPGVPANPTPNDDRFESPAAPRTFFGGIRITM